MIGVICSVIAGAVMSLQGVFNTRLSGRIGLLESNLYVQLTAALLGGLAVLFFGRGSFLEIKGARPYELLGGLLGFVITLTVMLSIKGLSPTAAISIILVAQLATAAMIDAFGWFGSERIPFTWQKYVGLALMLAGIVLFKLRIPHTSGG